MSSLMYYVENSVDFLLGFSLLGFIEVVSVAFIIYYIYTKTRAPVIIGNLFPTLQLNLPYRSSLEIFNNMGNEFFTKVRGSTTDTKYNNEVKTKDTQVESTFNQHGTGTQNMLKVTPLAGRKPYNSIFDWGVYFPYVAQALRSKIYEYPQISGLVTKDPILNRAIKQSTEDVLKEKKQQNSFTGTTSEGASVDAEIEDSDDDEEQQLYQKTLNQQEKRSISILNDMRSKISHLLLSFTSWVLYHLLPCFLSGVVTHTKQIEMLKTASEKAPGIPLIFLPLHRSHLDYIMVTFILTNNDIKCPLVAAGNNLQIPFFGGLLRGLGAFFIKRKIDPVVGKKDILYRAVLHLYLQHALKMGHNVEFFIEGGRTRTGKPCLPKNGILSVVVNAFMDGSIPDALLVPVSVNYERLVDGNFVREQTGERKVPESFRNAVSSIWKALNSKYGLMRIDFNEPYSIKELVLSYNKIAQENGGTRAGMKIYKPSARQLQHNQSSSSLYGTDVICEEHRTLIDSISRQVVYDCAAATSVMTTNALAHILLTRFRAGGFEDEIALAIDSLRNYLKGRRDIGFSGESSHIIKYASDLLGTSLVTRTKKDTKYFIEPKRTIEAAIELAYYANTLTPHFVLESIVLTTIHLLLSNKPKDSGISRKQLIEACLEHCDVLRYEFIISKPTQNLENLIDSAIDNLAMKDLIKHVTIEEDDIAKQSRRLASYIENNDTDLGESGAGDNGIEYEIPELYLNDKHIEEQNAVQSILAPFAHSYLAVAKTLKLLYKTSMLETEFVKIVIKDIRNQVESGSCPYGESVSTESVKNCLKLLEKWNVLEVYNQHGLRLLSLGNFYESSESIENIIQRIGATVPVQLKETTDHISP